MFPVRSHYQVFIHAPLFLCFFLLTHRGKQIRRKTQLGYKKEKEGEEAEDVSGGGGGDSTTERRVERKSQKKTRLPNLKHYEKDNSWLKWLLWKRRETFIFYLLFVFFLRTFLISWLHYKKETMQFILKYFYFICQMLLCDCFMYRIYFLCPFV